jgi:hypothetical protein
MVRLAREVSRIIVSEYGTLELMRKLSDPFWFQAFGCVLGYDWHSSGVTTVVCGALKQAWRPISKEIGLFIAGGKGATSRKTPSEIEALALLSEVIYGAEQSFRDPARFSFAHGAKDGTPFPVDRRTYDASIHILCEAVERAKLGNREKLDAIKRLDVSSK